MATGNGDDDDEEEENKKADLCLKKVVRLKTKKYLRKT